MSDPQHFNAEAVDSVMSWGRLVDALFDGHKWPRATIQDIHAEDGDNRNLTRLAWISGKGIGLKSMTIFPGNNDLDPPRPSIQGVFVLFDPDYGHVRQTIDGAAITRWKTAGDSVLGAKLLARPDSKALTVVGAGTMADTLIDAYRTIFPDLETIRIWNRTRPRAKALAARWAAKGVSITIEDDLQSAVGAADIVTSATMTTKPILEGAWFNPGTHIDVIGAFTPTMRECDDETLKRARIFADARESALHDIGELLIPLKAGVISETDVLADFYDMAAGADRRKSDNDITFFKNGGGAHLDLMTAICIAEAAGG